MKIILTLTVVLPIIAGFCMLLRKPTADKTTHVAALITVCANAALTWLCVFFADGAEITLLRFTDELTLTLGMDGLSRAFAGMVSILWIFATVYAFGYMAHEGMQQKFFAFFVMSLGVVMGVALSRNLFSLYLFYEYLTFATLPLVMHQMSRKARYAGKIYMIFSIAGGAAVFVSMMWLSLSGVKLDFALGGAGAVSPALYWAFALALLGFGVKAALFPLHYWLPTASVAPTPVTALLHAVAVVKSGVFAIARLTYFVIGAAALSGTWAQYFMTGISAFTVLYGSAMALREPHLKRRLAYSTISNLSYILLGIAVMSPASLVGAMLHMIYHGFIKITLFCCAGAILVKTGAEYVRELHGYSKRMPVTLACFAICGLGLIGVPPFAAFSSKYLIATSALSALGALGWLVVAALLVSEVLTALYILQVVLAAYFPDDKLVQSGARGDCANTMTAPVVILTIATVALALLSKPLVDLLTGLLGGAL